MVQWEPSNRLATSFDTPKVKHDFHSKGLSISDVTPFSSEAFCDDIMNNFKEFLLKSMTIGVCVCKKYENIRETVKKCFLAWMDRGNPYGTLVALK